MGQSFVMVYLTKEIEKKSLEWFKVVADSCFLPLNCIHVLPNNEVIYLKYRGVLLN